MSKWITAITLSLTLMMPGAVMATVLAPMTEARYAAAPSDDAGLGCYFAGRWIAPDVGSADIRVQGNRLTGVMLKFDDSLARNLYEMHFEAVIDERSRTAKGSQSYVFLTGFMKPSYSGDFTLTMHDDLSAVTLVFTNGFFAIEEILVKTKSGVCR